MKKYILFDNDGVLVHTEPWYFKATQLALKEFFNFDYEFEDYNQHMISGGNLWQRVKEQGFPDKIIQRAKDQRNIYYQEFLKTKDISIPQVEKTLEILSKKYKMGIVTTSKRTDFNIIHKNNTLTQYMDFVLCLEDYKLTKPNPDPYLKGLELLNASAQESIVVEDSKRGLTSAVNAGIDCVMVHNEFTSSQDFSEASYKVKSFSDLLDIL